MITGLRDKTYDIRIKLLRLPTLNIDEYIRGDISRLLSSSLCMITLDSEIFENFMTKMGCSTANHTIGEIGLRLICPIL